MLARLVLISFTFAASIAVPNVLAQAFPSKPIRLIVPFPAGGGSDQAARTLQQPLSEALGQPIVVDNRSGAQGSVGTAIAAKARADGYTLLLSDVGVLGITPWLYKDAGYDPIKDFVHIGLATTQPIIVIVHPSFPAKNLRELVALAKAKPDHIKFASTAANSQLTGELFKILTDIKLLHVPYKGAAPAIIALVGGEVDVMFGSPASVPMIKAGKARALAVTSATRLPALPDVMTSRESGYPDFDVAGWYGLAAPAGTPKAVITRLNKGLNDVLTAPGVKEKLSAQGLDAKTSTPEEMSAITKSAYERWGKVVKAAGMKAE